MKRDYGSTKTRLAAAFAILLAATSMTAAADLYGYGASGAAASAPNWTVEQMLRYAVEDEYAARAEYVAIMKKFGVSRPFSNIKESEEQHIQWLTDLYTSRGIPIPADQAASKVVIPATLTEAYKIGEKAEIDNIAMYDAFLRSPELKKAENADLVSIFTRLKAASENHLRSFRNQLSR